MTNELTSPVTGKKIGCVNHDCEECAKRDAVIAELLRWKAEIDSRRIVLGLPFPNDYDYSPSYAVNTLIDAVVAEAKLPRWQPMETAPKDGTKILVVRAGEDEIEITEWCEIEHAHFEEAESGLYRKVQDEPITFWNGNGHRATHWMPLPEPPREGKA